MDNLMHNTLEEIATHVRTIELPTPAQQPETESFYEDSPPEESLAQDSEGDQPGYYQGRKIRDSYPTPPATPPPAALLARLMAGASLDEKDRQGTLRLPHGQQRSWRVPRPERLENTEE
ncbi:hypothetical protein A1F94_006879 [Pyrenophora tritici-repentis]|nr:hypothetical protein A1F94_006879 [Pyrenophora tritici-repentis]